MNGPSAQVKGSPVTKLVQSAFQVCDGASSVFFRVVFGSIVAKWAWDYLELGRARRLFVEPAYHFSYYGFEWVQPLPGELMTVLFLGLLLLGICVAIGCCYRATSLLLAIGFTYVFLLDRTNYQNHYYLIGLIAWWLPWMPLNRDVSVDAWLWPQLRSQTISRWTLWMLRFHIALPYFFGGIAKLNPDWLLGQPLEQMLAEKSSLPILGAVLAHESVALALAWCGLCFDLLVVPMLMWSKTRALAFSLCIVFHLMNSVIFNIHVFPWFMLAATPIFFPADWPRRVLGGFKLPMPADETHSASLSVRRMLFASVIGLYVIFHCLWPLRHNVYPGDASWNEQGHYFAWRMMLRGKSVVLGYAIKDQVTGAVVDGNINRFLVSEQSERFGRDPEMILQFAHFLGEEYKISSGNTASVHVLVLASLNGRKPELMIDPNVDLMQQARGFHVRDWVMPQTEPLRRPAWNLPVEQWRQHVKIPELQFLVKRDENSQGASSPSSFGLDTRLAEAR